MTTVRAEAAVREAAALNEAVREAAALNEAVRDEAVRDEETARDEAALRHEPAVPELVATSSAVVYRNRWMTVREDVTLRPDGVTGIYGVVEKPDFALIVPYADGGFHLVEQYRYTVGARYWEFPQGSWEDRPDADPLELARGELAEETGLRAGRMVRLGHLYEAYGFADQGFSVFLATDVTPGEQDLDESEAGLVTRWFPEGRVWDLIAAGRFKDASSVAALALFQRHREGLGV